MGTEVAAPVSSDVLTTHRRPLHALTGIRFFAAYFVVVFHSRLAQICFDHHLAWAGNFVKNGFLAVPLFFILSGFILAYTYLGQIERAGDHRRFWEARFARIWPVYAVSLLFSSLVSFSIPPIGPAASTLAMVQAWNPLHPEYAGTWNFVCWTLSVEAFFYLCFPWVQTWLEDHRERTQRIFVALTIGLCIVFNTSSRSLGYTAVGFFRYTPLPLVHLPEFLTGVGLGNLFLRRLSGVRASPPGVRLLPGPAAPRGLWTYASAILTVLLLCQPGGRWTSLIVPAFALLVFSLAAETTLLSRLLSTRLILLGGGISYSVYLMQMPVKAWVNLGADHLHLQSTMLRLAANFILLTLLSLILFKAVEGPARRLIRTFFARLEQKRTPASFLAAKEERQT